MMIKIKKDKINEINSKIKGKDIVTQKLVLEVLNRQVQKSDRINSDRQSGSDQLGSTRTNSDPKKK